MGADTPQTMKRRAPKYSEAEAWERFGDWLTGIPGSLLLEQELDCLEQLLGDLFGYYLLQLGYPAGRPGLLVGSRIRHHLILDPLATSPEAHLIGDPARLPVASDSVDVVLLQHGLDFAAQPHQVLREAERVLIPEGRLLLLGFDPWGLWGLWRRLRRPFGRLPWDAGEISQRRVRDWLSLLGFDIESSRSLMARPPLSSHRLMQRLAFLERLGWPLLGNVYLIQAVKRVSTLTPIKPKWAARSRVVGAGAIEPTARSLR